MTNPDNTDADEVAIYKDLVLVLKENLAAIKRQKPDERDLKNLFLLARTYHVLKDDLRKDLNDDALKQFRNTKNDSGEQL